MMRYDAMRRRRFLPLSLLLSLASSSLSVSVATPGNTRGLSPSSLAQLIKGLLTKSCLHCHRRRWLALALLPASHTCRAATVMKDLGKVLGFGGGYGEARDWLARSLRIHQQLLGEKHVRTTNVERLSRYG